MGLDLHTPRQWLAYIFRSSKRIAVLVVGLALVGGGLALLVLPGPGILVIIAGLAVLATEFVWAEKMLDRAKTHASSAKDAATRWGRRRDSGGDGGNLNGRDPA
jgi:uncharacterized protein (TIGR02611 family)